MQKLEIKITKSWRKSISMRFDKHWVLQVKAPKFLLTLQIDNFISKNQIWIDSQHNKILERKINKQHYLFWDILDTGTIYNFVPWEDNLVRFYKSEAKKYLKSRCDELAKKYGFTYKWVKITSATTRWGSCSSKKTINFSYRLIMAPKEAIDYVIIHELCHLREMNHWARFWKEVHDIMPEYKQHEDHLKQEGWKYRI